MTVEMKINKKEISPVGLLLKLDDVHLLHSLPFPVISSQIVPGLIYNTVEYFFGYQDDLRL